MFLEQVLIALSVLYPAGGPIALTDPRDIEDPLA